MDLNLSDLMPTTTNLKEKILGGEDGKKFSGVKFKELLLLGLFIKRNFIILDETLNALDYENIDNVMNFLNKIPSLTLLLIAHSENVAKKCDRIVKIKNKVVHEIKFS